MTVDFGGISTCSNSRWWSSSRPEAMPTSTAAPASRIHLIGVEFSRRSGRSWRSRWKVPSELPWKCSLPRERSLLREGEDAEVCASSSRTEAGTPGRRSHDRRAALLRLKAYSSRRSRAEEAQLAARTVVLRRTGTPTKPVAFPAGGLPPHQVRSAVRLSAEPVAGSRACCAGSGRPSHALPRGC